jgi:heptosyltransferase III
LRCLKDLGNGMIHDPLSWDLGLTEAEQQKAQLVLDQWASKKTFICASIGTKAWVKDWGSDNWTSLFKMWSAKHPEVGLVMVGSSDEYDLSQQMTAFWRGPTRNLCGLTPRVTAAIIKAAAFFVGHDSGPMHLAASVGKPCVAIFSARDMPGEWYPFGVNHRILYHQTPCFGCRLTEMCDHDKNCIRSITIEEVCVAMEEIWERETRSVSAAKT